MPALLRYLPQLNHNHIAYVGSVYGSGAWAVAEACTQLGLQCSLFLAKSDYTPSWMPDLARTTAQLNWCHPTPVTDLHASITRDYPALCNLPLGFDTPDFIATMATVMKDILPTPPDELWLPALSGVLARAACLAFPNTDIHAVSAAKHPGDIGRAQRHHAPEKFHHSAKMPPPYPACPFSDAKVWQCAVQSPTTSKAVWNVSR
jgi:hypothetical protein